MRKLKRDTNEPVCQIAADVEGQLAVAKREGVRSAGVSFYVQNGETGPHFICLYTENIQCPMINHKGKEYFLKMYVHV